MGVFSHKPRYTSKKRWSRWFLLSPTHQSSSAPPRFQPFGPKASFLPSCPPVLGPAPPVSPCSGRSPQMAHGVSTVKHCASFPYVCRKSASTSPLHEGCYRVPASQRLAYYSNVSKDHLKLQVFFSPQLDFAVLFLQLQSRQFPLFIHQALSFIDMQITVWGATRIGLFSRHLLRRFIVSTGIPL